VIAESLWNHDGVYPPSRATKFLADAIIAALRADPVAVLGLLSPEVRADMKLCAIHVRSDRPGVLTASSVARDRVLDLLARSEP
jgi:hypothetical protein